MHALRAQSAFAGGIYWPRALDLAWTLTANLALWMLLLKAPSVFGAA
jgi:hypothetical protein